MSLRTLLSLALKSVVVGLFGLGSLAALAWQPPTQAPTGGNVPAPINVGSTAQTKTGPLTLGGLTLSNLASTTIRCLQVETDGTISATSDGCGSASGSLDGSGTANRIPLFSDSNTLTDSTIYYNAGDIGINTGTPSYDFSVAGNASVSGNFYAGNLCVGTLCSVPAIWSASYELGPGTSIQCPSGYYVTQLFGFTCWAPGSGGNCYSYFTMRCRQALY